MATGTPSRTVGYLSVHPSVDFARSFLARTEQVTDSVHSAPACLALSSTEMDGGIGLASARATTANRSEEHTSELQSRLHLVCRLLLEKKKKKKKWRKQTANNCIHC